MKIHEFVKERPLASGVTIASIIAGGMVLSQAMPTLELIVRITKAPDVAEAAKQIAEESREWIDAYIAEQRHQREMDQKLAEQQAEYQRQMLELQRQQAPNVFQQLPQMAPAIREWDGTDEAYYCCDYADREWCFQQYAWYVCR